MRVSDTNPGNQEISPQFKKLGGEKKDKKKDMEELKKELEMVRLSVPPPLPQTHCIFPLPFFLIYETKVVHTAWATCLI